MQTRNYPRTLHEAFPRTVEYGCAIERPAKRRSCVVPLLFIMLLLAWAAL